MAPGFGRESTYLLCCWMCRELTATTGIDIVTLKNVLRSMLFAKDLAVLKKTPKSTAIELDHVIEINPAYKNPSLVGLRDCPANLLCWRFHVPVVTPCVGGSCCDPFGTPHVC